jgi:NADP-reducing hydrogenase subunit HndB
MAKLTLDELRKMRESSKRNIYLREGDFKGKVVVHMGTCGIAAGAREIMSTFLDEIENRDINDIRLASSGCAGLCSEEPMITVELGESAPVKYSKLSPKKVRKIFQEHVIDGHILEEYLIGIGSERAG